MKASIIKSSVALLAALVVLFGCSKDSTPEVSKYVGSYAISEARLAANLVIPTNQLGNYTVASGTDITTTIQSALLKSVACSSPSDTYIELKADQSISMSCKGANAINAGTWEEVSETEINLNLNATALPPAGFILTIKEIVIDATSLTGKTTVPFQSSTIAAMISPLTLSSSAPPLFSISISIKFLKK